MHAPRRTLALALLAVATLSVLAVGATAAQTATEPANGTAADADETVGTEIAVTFDRELSAVEREVAAQAIADRLAGSPGYNGTVEAAGDRLVVQVRPTAPPAVVDLLLQRGNVTVTARSPAVEGARLFTNRGVAEVGGIRRSGGTTVLPVRLTADAAGRLSGTLQRLNLTDNLGGCDAANRSGYCLVVALDGEVVNTASITPAFAAAVEDGSFNDSRAFGLSAEDPGTVVRMQVALAAEPLPANATAARVENVTAFGPVTAAPAPSPTPTRTPTGTPETPGGDSPGFGVVALVGAAAALAWRR